MRPRAEQPHDQLIRRAKDDVECTLPYPGQEKGHQRRDWDERMNSGGGMGPSRQRSSPRAW